MHLYSQSKIPLRDSRQVNLEDSLSVYWTAYPNPFSPFTKDSIRYSYPTKGFYCFLPGKIEVGLIDINSDSIVYKYELKAGKYNFFLFRLSSVKDSSIFERKGIDYGRIYPFKTYDFVVIVENRLKTRKNFKLIFREEKYISFQ